MSAHAALPDTSRPRLFSGFAAIAAVIVVWSGFNIVSRLGGRSPLTPYDMAAIRFVFSGLVCLPFVLARWRRLDWPKLAVLAALGGVGYALLAYAGFALAPTAHAGILVNGGIPFASALIAWLVLGHRPGVRTELALLVAGTGIMLIGLHSFGQFAGVPAHQWLGDVFFVLAALCYASFGLLLKQWQVSPIDATIGVAVIALVCYLPVYLLFLPKATASVPVSFVLGQGVYQGILAASLASLLFAYAIHNIGPQRATLMLAMVPGLSALAAVPLLGEPLDAVTIAGVLLVTVGAVLGATHQPVR
ncbi:MAG: EamA family transporter [Hydrogenophilales bacterium 16-64-46]|nr:MAG: EamA family transporter [Hydrogenophilales bacterium 12-64-13]OYZ06098.1 MAG: EamA family transporter [Hydrogenophilales bacterium 16-64-46]OZA39003.1 MAG: EamA family transporter [Hydrogenophilales bacterium 17-64-34]HQT01247.1 DMT family transporter [Thiobacillus sp.]